MKLRRENGAYDGDTGKRLTTQELDENFSILSAQTSHALAQGELLYVDGSGDWQKAIATAESTLAKAIMQFSIDANNLMVVLMPCQVADATHGFTLGADLYLSQSVAGAATETKPSTGWIQQVGYVMTADIWIFQPQRGEFI